MLRKLFDESKIRRHPRGTKRGGQFAPKFGESSPLLSPRQAAPRAPLRLRATGPLPLAVDQTVPTDDDLAQATWERLKIARTAPFFKVTTPDGRAWFVKAIWQSYPDEGPAEVVAAAFGHALGLPVPPARIVPAVLMPYTESTDGGLDERTSFGDAILMPWIDGVTLSEATVSWRAERHSPDLRVRTLLFDYAINNGDRHAGNIMYTRPVNWRQPLDAHVRLIDHNFAFSRHEFRGNKLTGSLPDVTVDRSYVEWLAEGAARARVRLGGNPAYGRFLDFIDRRVDQIADLFDALDPTGEGAVSFEALQDAMFWDKVWRKPYPSDAPRQAAPAPAPPLPDDPARLNQSLASGRYSLADLFDWIERAAAATENFDPAPLLACLDGRAWTAMIDHDGIQSYVELARRLQREMPGRRNRFAPWQRGGWWWTHHWPGDELAQTHVLRHFDARGTLTLEDVAAAHAAMPKGDSRLITPYAGEVLGQHTFDEVVDAFARHGRSLAIPDANYAGHEAKGIHRLLAAVRGVEEPWALQIAHSPLMMQPHAMETNPADDAWDPDYAYIPALTEQMRAGVACDSATGAVVPFDDQDRRVREAYAQAVAEGGPVTWLSNPRKYWKLRVIDRLSQRTGVRGVDVSTLLQAWAGFTRPEMVIMSLHEQASKLFGVPLTSYEKALIDEARHRPDQEKSTLFHRPKEGLFEAGRKRAYVQEAQQQVRALLQAIYDDTQAWFRERNITHVTLFRGMTDPTIDPSVAPGTVRRIEENAVASWSLSPVPAVVLANQHSLWQERDGAVVYAMRVPVERILSTPLTGMGALHEKEVVLLGSGAPSYARVVYHPDWQEKALARYDVTTDPIAPTVKALAVRPPFDESKIRRHPRGTRRGGQFAPKYAQAAAPATREERSQVDQFVRSLLAMYPAAGVAVQALARRLPVRGVGMGVRPGWVGRWLPDDTVYLRLASGNDLAIGLHRWRAADELYDFVELHTAILRDPNPAEAAQVVEALRDVAAAYRRPIVVRDTARWEMPIGPASIAGAQRNAALSRWEVPPPPVVPDPAAYRAALDRVTRRLRDRTYEQAVILDPAGRVVMEMTDFEPQQVRINGLHDLMAGNTFVHTHPGRLAFLDEPASVGFSRADFEAAAATGAQAMIAVTPWHRYELAFPRPLSRQEASEVLSKFETLQQRMADQVRAAVAAGRLTRAEAHRQFETEGRHELWTTLAGHYGFHYARVPHPDRDPAFDAAPLPPPRGEGAEWWVEPRQAPPRGRTPTSARAAAVRRQVLDAYARRKDEIDDLDRHIQDVLARLATQGSSPSPHDITLLNWLTRDKEDVLAQVRAEALDALAVPDPAMLRFKGSEDSVDGRIPKLLDQSAAILNRLVSRRVAEVMGEEAIAAAPSGRMRSAYDDDWPAILLGLPADVSAVLHEAGHWIEHKARPINRAALAFRRRRTRGRKPVYLTTLTGNPHFRDEQALPDEFVDPYVGAYYRRANGWQATEVISMGLEYLHREPWTLAERDPEMFDLVVDLLRGDFSAAPADDSARQSPPPLGGWRAATSPATNRRVGNIDPGAVEEMTQEKLALHVSKVDRPLWDWYTEGFRPMPRDARHFHHADVVEAKHRAVSAVLQSAIEQPDEARRDAATIEALGAHHFFPHFWQQVKRSKQRWAEETVEQRRAVVQWLLDKRGIEAQSKVDSISYDEANGLVARWAADSNAPNMAMIALHQAAAEEFGLELSDWQGDKFALTLEKARPNYEQLAHDHDPRAASYDEMFRHPFELRDGNQEFTQDTFKRARARLQRVLRDMYARTQLDLARYPGETVRLYRGVLIDITGRDPLVPGEVVDLINNSLESWTAMQSVADDFRYRAHELAPRDPTRTYQAVTIAVDMPKQRVLATPRTGLGCLDEWEFIVLAGTPTEDQSIVMAVNPPVVNRQVVKGGKK